MKGCCLLCFLTELLVPTGFPHGTSAELFLFLETNFMTHFHTWQKCYCKINRSKLNLVIMYRLGHLGNSFRIRWEARRCSRICSLKGALWSFSCKQMKVMFPFSVTPWGLTTLWKAFPSLQNICKSDFFKYFKFVLSSSSLTLLAHFSVSWRVTATWRSVELWDPLKENVSTALLDVKNSTGNFLSVKLMPGQGWLV